ncbi:1-phosphatidylinositol-4-phosphate 5-kinase [Fistulifera solaris]|uniref:1-phosphatidylinositol-4-phosphate 5-kinase n=1 Tax=Fistulifera solaris TaxID=1519565 RepID=A0A1Z5JDG8_FISSO|nr:1-phosphatidylinositol-4-phosphate 5-kinase [Fistulifera solaris]|eukprot:GAX12037.1 1-phosphatidylinositol-4-phosphate 5-kinase [Fistulifera solaris]
MIGTETILGVVLLGQLILSIIQRQQQQQQPRLEGPPIRPEESPYLWEVTRAFREAVALDLEQDRYTQYPVQIVTRSIDTHQQGYSLSLQPDPSFLSSQSTEASEIQQHQETNWTACSIHSNETETLHTNKQDFLLETLPQDEERLPGAVTIHLQYSKNDVGANTTFPTQTNSSTDYCIELPAHNQTLMPSPIQIRAYAANEFAQLRTLFGISEPGFRKSLLDGSFVSFESNSKGAARVGGIFFFSPDGGYLIKSIKADEVPTLLQMLPKYTEFMKQYGRTTLLTRFCGMYDICIEGTHHTLVIMNAVFPSQASIKERYDLKGSTVGRKVSEEERRRPDVVLKDINFLEQKDISIRFETRKALLDQLRQDVSLLQNCSVIDYSLLVGIEPVTRKKHSQFGSRIKRAFLSAVQGPVGVHGGKFATLHGARKGGEPIVLYLGLIDFLQPFNYKKYLEWKVKSLLHENKEFSCIPPEKYSRRLLSFLDDNIG